MKQKFLIVCLAIGLVGCHFPPLHEIDYTGQLPSNVPASLAVSKEFAADLVAETTGTNLKIYAEYPGDPIRFKTDPKGFVDMRTRENPPLSGKGNVSVHIAAYQEPMHVIFVMIYGDIDMPEANVIAAKAEEIFARKYPGFKLVRFTAHSGPLGP